MVFDARKQRNHQRNENEIEIELAFVYVRNEIRVQLFEHVGHDLHVNENRNQIDVIAQRNSLFEEIAYDPKNLLFSEAV